MTVGGAHRKYTSIFLEHGMADAADEARVLICYVLKIKAVDFFAQPDRTLNDGEQSALLALANRRLAGEPAAYIINCREFYGIDFYVDRRVLVPRPETEILVEEALEYCKSKCGGRLSVADVGTGSGAIAVALALNSQDVFIYAIDISFDALVVAGQNVNHFGLKERVRLLQGDLLSTLPEHVDIIVANLPYIAEHELKKLPFEVSGCEPEIALHGGNSGTEVIGRLLAQVKGKINKDGLVLLEIGLGQEDEIFKMVKKMLPTGKIFLKRDLAGVNRIVKIVI